MAEGGAVTAPRDDRPLLAGSQTAFVKGMMAESSIWTDIEKRFKSLQLEDGDQLRANWISTAWDAEGASWYMSGNQNLHVHHQFELLAERAVVELGHETGPASLFLC